MLFSVPIMLPLSRALAEHQPHVLHFIGHAALSRGEGCLVCEDGRQLSDWVTPSRLAGMLPPSVGLLCLSSPSEVRNYQILGFPRLAQSSSALSLPSMVANQYQVNRDRSTRFWKAFYKALAHTQCDLIEAAWRAGQPDAANAVVPDLPAFALYLRGTRSAPLRLPTRAAVGQPAACKALEIEACASGQAHEPARRSAPSERGRDAAEPDFRLHPREDTRRGGRQETRDPPGVTSDADRIERVPHHPLAGGPCPNVGSNLHAPGSGASTSTSARSRMRSATRG